MKANTISYFQESPTYELTHKTYNRYNYLNAISLWVTCGLLVDIFFVGNVADNIFHMHQLPYLWVRNLKSWEEIGEKWWGQHKTLAQI